MYQAVVTIAVARAEGAEFSPQTIHMLRRFVPFIWTCLWTVLITGVALMLFSTRFVFFEFRDSWSVLLALKQIAFLVMMFFSVGYARMVTRLDEMMKSGKAQHPLDELIPYYQRVQQFGRINIALGITSLLLAAGMR